MQQPKITGPCGARMMVEQRRKKILKGDKTMAAEMVVALVLGIPIIVFPAAFVWYLTAGGLVAAARRRRVEKREVAKA